MALIKNIELDNGVVVSYHRVVSVFCITNRNCTIEIASYINKAKREEEKEKLEKGEEMNIFIHATYIPVEYRKDWNVDTAYEYLKTLLMFESAEDD